MIVRLTRHKTVDAIVHVHAGPELADVMGRLQFARWNTDSKTYWVETKHLDKLVIQLEKAGHTIVDDRALNDAEKFTGPLPECASCGKPATRRGDRTLRRCTGCGAPWRSVLPDTTGAPGGLLPLLQCDVCGHRQRAGGAYCGQCGAGMPDPPGGAPRPAPAEQIGERAPLQDPLPVAAGIPEHLAAGIAAHTDDEGADREWYP